MPGIKCQVLLVFLLLLQELPASFSAPLSTNNRWIVDSQTGERVKLACVNWPSHVDPMLAEGLDKQPLPVIASLILKYNYNCIRFTWATYMFTRPEYSYATISESFDRLNLTVAKAGLAKNNPAVLGLTTVEAFEYVIDVLGQHGLMMVLDNQISQPIWCCSDNDDNGFPNDAEYDPKEWLYGLSVVARRFYGKPQVIGMSLRNEMRGPSQNKRDWYRYIEAGAKKVHETNPDVLVIASGISYGTDLTYLKDKPLALSLDNKLVMETHLYAFTAAPKSRWIDRSVNNYCADRYNFINNNIAFVTTGDHAVPLFFGEFGLDQTHTDSGDDRFLSCFAAYMVDKDMDWGLWALQGSYYFRGQVVNMEETYGLLDINWGHMRNPQIQRRFQLMRTRLQGGSNSAATAQIFFHPQTGGCVYANNNTSLYEDDCSGAGQWKHDGEEAPIRLIGTDLCLKAVAEGKAPILSTDCLGSQSIWRTISQSKLHLAAKGGNGEDLCLDMESPNSNELVTRKCICATDDNDCKDDPTSQWFKFALTNVASH